MFHLYEYAIPGTNIHLVLAVIILLEIILFFNNTIQYLSRPEDKGRARFLLMTLLFIQYNITGGLFIDTDLELSVISQGAIAMFSNLLLSVFLPYYIYKTLDLKKLRFFAFYGSLIFLFVPFVFLFILPLVVFNNYEQASRLYIIIPVVYGFAFMYIMTWAFLDKKRNENLSSRYKKMFYGTYVATLFWVMMPVAIFFGSGQITEHLISNFGYLIMSIIYLRINILDSRDEYESLKRSKVNLYNAKVVIEQKFKEKAEELEKEKQKSIDAFVKIAHDTKTPLTLIKNNIDDCAEYSKELSNISYLVDSLDNMLSNIINNKLVENGEIVYVHDKVVDCSTFLELKLEQFKSIACKKGLELRAGIEGNVLTKIALDALESLVDNLVSNAVKFTNKGFVEVSLSGNESSLIINVKDTGVGIPEEMKGKVFDSFFHYSEDPGISGQGLGLANVKNIVDSLGGEILLSSKAGEGTEFKVVLARYEPSENEQIYRFRKNEHSLEKDGIVPDAIIPNIDRPFVHIVEDNVELLQYLRQKFKIDFNVYVSSSCDEAFEKIKKVDRKPDLIVSDIMMDHGMDGVELLGALQASSYNYVPFLFLTAKISSIVKEQALSMGAIDFISKPFKIKEVINKAKSIIENSKKQKKMAYVQMREQMDEKFLGGYEAKVNKESFEGLCEKYKISNRERDVILLLKVEKTYKEIGEDLNISSKTVDNHIRSIYKKTGINTSVGLANKFF